MTLISKPTKLLARASAFYGLVFSRTAGCLVVLLFICAATRAQLKTGRNIGRGAVDPAVAAVVRLLEKNFLSQVSCYMETVAWTVGGKDPVVLPAAWKNMRPWVSGEITEPTYKHWVTWSEGRFGGLCRVSQFAKASSQRLGSYFDGKGVLHLYLDQSRAGIRPFGFATIGVTVWPHYLLGILGVEALASHVQLARQSGTLRHETTAGESELEFSMGVERRVTIRLSNRPVLHMLSIDIADRRGSSLYKMVVTSWQDEGRRWPATAIVHYPLIHPSDRSVPGRQPRMIHQHLQLRWSQRNGIDGRYFVGVAKRCRQIAYQSEVYVTPDGFDRLMEEDIGRMLRTWPEARGVRVADTTLHRASTNAFDQIDFETEWAKPVSRACESWPRLTRTLLEGRSSLLRLQSEFCAQGALAFLARITGQPLAFRDLYVEVPSAVLSLDRVVSLAASAGIRLRAVHVPAAVLYELDTPFLLHEKTGGGVGHLSVGIPIDSSRIGIWRTAGTLRLGRKDRLAEQPRRLILIREDKADELAHRLGNRVLWWWLLGGTLVLITAVLLLRRHAVRPLGIATMILVLAALASCGERKACLEISPERISVVLSTFGEMKWETVTITNPAEHACTVRVGPANCGCVLLQTRALTIAPGAAKKIRFMIQARSAGPQSYHAPVRHVRTGEVVGMVRIELNVTARLTATPKTVSTVLSGAEDTMTEAFRLHVWRVPHLAANLSMNSTNANIIPSIKSRSTRRISGFEVDEYVIGLRAKVGCSGVQPARIQFAHPDGRSGHLPGIAVPASVLVRSAR